MGMQSTMMESLKASTGVMEKVNGEMNIKDIQTMMKSFTKEQMKAEMNQEMIGEAMDFGDANEEADDVYN